MPRQVTRNPDNVFEAPATVPHPRLRVSELTGLDAQVERSTTASDSSIASPGNSPRATPSHRASLHRRQPWTRLSALVIACDLLAAGATASFSRSPAWCMLMGCIVVVAVRHSGLQRKRLAPNLLDDLPSLITLALVGLGVVLLVRGIVARASGTNSVRDASYLMGFLVLFRMAVYTVLRMGRRRGRFLHNTLFVGHGRLGQVLSQSMLDDPRYGLRPVGYVCAGEPSQPNGALPCVGELSSMSDLVRQYAADAVVIADVEPSEEQLTSVTRAFDGEGVAVYMVPRLWELHGSAQGCEMIRGIPLIRLSRPAYESLTWPLKRALDLVAASLAVLLLSPVLLMCALLVRRESGPGVIFRQKRIGRDGRQFELLKFRSLRPVDDAEAATTWSVAEDARLRTVGRWMRRLSLDELPQLFNVLRGDMSLVGPRPERPFFVAQFTSEFGEYGQRHRVPSGMTGWAQIHGLRGDTSVATRARYDNYYIENWSLWLDVKILLRTVRQVIVGAGR
jgi:exopolysaccharide biosynthesis polyprenyl glycosylphosphotransferase